MLQMLLRFLVFKHSRTASSPEPLKQQPDNAPRFASIPDKFLSFEDLLCFKHSSEFKSQIWQSRLPAALSEFPWLNIKLSTCDKRWTGVVIEGLFPFCLFET
jgi:hypothetical protein